MSDKIVQITDANFQEEILNSSLPVLLDFLGAMVCALPHGTAHFGAVG